MFLRSIETPVNLLSADAHMKKIVAEQSSKAFYCCHSGLALVGNLIKGYTSLCERLEKDVPGQPRISHGDGVETSLGLLCLGTSDFEGVDGVVHDQWWKEALGHTKGPFGARRKHCDSASTATFGFLSGGGAVQFAARSISICAWSDCPAVSSLPMP
jgi:hypothetical protein